MWELEYNNDTGPLDEYFYEWWAVTNGDKSFKCDSEESAEWLCNILNNLPAAIVGKEGE
jgi:hypothetical protein